MGESAGLESLQQSLVSEAERLGVDLVLQRDDAQRRYKRLAVFDMDSTLIKTEVIDELAELAGVRDQVSAITERAMQGEIDFRESFTQRMALLKGLSTEHLVSIAHNLPIMDGAERLFATLRAYGIKTAIISGGFTIFAEHLQEKLGIDYVFANQLGSEADKLTGEVIEPIVDASRKAEIVRTLAHDLEVDLSQVIAVGDGANDLLMLKAVGTGIAFRAKPVVRQSANLALTTMGLEGVLYLMGLDKRDHHGIDD
jgi:phosphoserine phosphatase